MAEGDRSRIQARNRAAILDAALDLFAAEGFRGATLDRIAARAGLSKPNVLYYFPSKEAIREELLAGLHDAWLAPLQALDPAGEPLEEVRAYVAAKLALSRDRPRESRLFAGEVLHGAPHMAPTLAGPLRAVVDDKAALLEQWMDEGRLARVPARHLIFSVWALTQHYADFETQVRAVLGEGHDPFAEAGPFLDGLFARLLDPAEPRQPPPPSPILAASHPEERDLDRPPLLLLGSLPAHDLAPLEAAHEVLAWNEADGEALLAEHGARIRAVATDGGRGLPRAIMDRLPALEVISVNGVGVDAVDLDEARRRGIGVGHTPGVLTGDVADLAVGMFLGLVRRIPEADAFARSGRWAEGAFPLTRRVGGMRAGVLGLGRIGEAIARRLGAFDVEVAYTSREPKDVPYEFVPDAVALAERSDVLVVALAATPETRHAVDARVIEALGPRGLLVNISRAANVDEGALLDALEGGRLGGAALDVFEGEPRIDPRWAMLPNVLLQPHAGSGTVETRAAMAQMMRDNLAAHFAGRPLPARAA